MTFGTWIDHQLALLREPDTLWPLLLKTASALFIALAVFAVLLLARKRLAAWLQRKKQALLIRRIAATLIAKTSTLFIAVVAFVAGARTLTLGPGMAQVLTSLFVIALMLQAASWASACLGLMLEHFARRRGDQQTVNAANSIIGLIARIAVWSIALMMILENLGFNVTALVTGLGIGGIAVGLAAQKVLGDLFASLSIVFDKPFEYGDFIISGESAGTIEHIGLKTTRLRSLSGEQIIVSNADLLGTRIRNYKRMRERRVAIVLHIVYGTPADILERIPAIVKDLIDKEPRARFDRCNFTSYADWALNFEIVYYVLSPSFRENADVTHAINLAIARRFGEEDIFFALPSGQPPRPWEEWQPKKAAAAP